MIGPAELAFCLALGIPSETPGYTYRARQAEIGLCVDSGIRHWEKTGDAGPLGQILDTQAACLVSCNWNEGYD